MKLFKRLATGLLLAGLSIVPAQAQIDQGKVSGNVRDQTAAFVPDVTVTVTNERTGEVRRGTTNGQGLFFIGNLRPSSYTIRVDKEGFSPIEYTNIALALGQELNLDFEFKPAGIAEELTVVADAPVLDVSSARVGVNVSEREVEGLPGAHRDGVAREPVDPPRVVLEGRHARRVAHAGERGGRAHLECVDHRELVGVLADELADAMEHGPPRHGRSAPPRA